MSRSRFVGTFAVAFCFFLAWRGSSSLVSLAREVHSYDLRSLLDAASLSQEERIRNTLRDDYELFAALRANVPANGLILFVTGSDLATVKRALRIGQLLYPPRFVSVARFLPLVPESVRRSNHPVFAVDLTREEKPARSSWEPIGDGVAFQLWRYRTPKEPLP